MQWRNTALDFSSLGALAATLAPDPTEQGLTRAPVAEDILVLEHVSRDDEVRALAARAPRSSGCGRSARFRTIARSRRRPCGACRHPLWFPDAGGYNPADWFARQVAQADRTDGDIDTLANADRPHQDLDLCGKPPGLARRSRALARHHARRRGQLSDALHERLAERFVDRRTSVLMRRLRENTMLETEIAKSGDVVVEGHPVGRLGGLPVRPPTRASGGTGRQGAARGRAEGARRRDRQPRHAARRMRPTSRSCSPPTADALARRSRSASWSAGDEMLARACASSPTSS